jgi:hypothetical protein
MNIFKSYCVIWRREIDYEKMIKYLKLDPKTSDLTVIRIIKVRTGYRCKDIRRIMVS